MFINPSLHEPRVIRWLTCILNILLNLFIDTLFYSIFFSDTGICEQYINEQTCITSTNFITNTNSCLWTANNNDGSCSMNPPPTTMIFIIVVVIITLVISLPLSIFYAYILSEFCSKYPNLEVWGLISVGWYGPRERNILASNNTARESPLKVLFQKNNGKIVFKEMNNENISETSTSFSLGKESSLNPNKDKTKLTMNKLNLEISKTYDDLHSTEYEVELLLFKAKRFLSMVKDNDINSNNNNHHSHYHYSQIYWKTADGKNKILLKQQAIEKYLGLDINGEEIPLSIWDYLYYYSNKQKIISKLNNIRKIARIIKDDITNDGSSEQYQRDIKLLQFFILENFTSFKKFILKKQFSYLSLSLPSTIHPLLWLISNLFILFSTLFFIYWILQWGLLNYGITFEHWAINFIIAISQDFFILEPLKICILHFISIYSLQPQLHIIYHVLVRIVMSYVHNQDTRNKSYRNCSSRVGNDNNNGRNSSNDNCGYIVDYSHNNDDKNDESNDDDFNIVQHFSPSCRTAKFKITRDLASSIILRYVDEVSIYQCKQKRNKPLSTISIFFLIIPMFITIINEILGDVILDIIIPTSFNFFIISNAYIFVIIGFFIIIPYLVLIIITYNWEYLKIKFIKNKNKKHVTRELDNSIEWYYNIDYTSLKLHSDR